MKNTVDESEMNILIVHSGNAVNDSREYTFVYEQARALTHTGLVNVSFFAVKGKGVFGYIRNYKSLLKVIKKERIDLIHAHYGLCGLLSNLQRRIPVVTTYHGSDVNIPRNRLLSKMAMILSSYNIFVSKKLMIISHYDNLCKERPFSIIPCGIDVEQFQNVDKDEARRIMGLKNEQKYVLFAGAFDKTVKNANLAHETIRHLQDVELIELKGYSREQVALLLYACDALLMTSHTEGSPTIIKEALACGCPIVSVDVGDVKKQIENVNGCHVSDQYDASNLAQLLKKSFSIERTNGRERIAVMGLDNSQVAKKIVEVYKRVLNG